MLVPFLPNNAPFTEEQRQWLNGYFAGWVCGTNGSATAPAFGGDGQVISGDGQAVGEPVLAEPEAPRYDRNNPFAARLLTNRALNADGSAKDVRHIEIDLSGSGLTYEVGDALGIIPQNCPALVDELLQAFGWTGDEALTLNGEALPLRDALQHHRTITEPPKALLEAYATQSGDGDLRAVLDNRDVLNDFLWDRDVLDLALAYPDVRFEPQAFIDLLRPLAHRLYSISSSPNAHPGQVHLTVGAVRYEAYGRAKTGVCSTFLADRCMDKTPLPVFVHHNNAFRLPADPATPVIMVGPGTGIAPFRAFLEERKASGATGKNWLFFGDQHEATDYLYRDELEAFLSDGTLNRLDLAWSRDGAEKVYVQHRMLEHAETLFAWLEEGAAFYVCGDASRMAKDVDAALLDVIRTAGGLTEDAAADYLKQLKRAKRYLRDVY